MRIMVLTDASFENCRGLRSQLGFVIYMVDANGRCNEINFGSNRCKRVTCSVLASEFHYIIVGFDFAYILRNLMSDMLGREVEVETLVDSKTVFEIISKDGNSTERRLKIDVFALR